QNEYHIACNISGAKGQKVFLLDIYGGVSNRSQKVPIDSLVPESDTFSFRGSFEEHKYYSLSIESSPKFMPFIIDTGRISIEGTMVDFPVLKLRGSLQNDLLREYGMLVNPFILETNKYLQKATAE